VEERRQRKLKNIPTHIYACTYFLPNVRRICSRHVSGLIRFGGYFFGGPNYVPMMITPRVTRRGYAKS